MATFVDKCVDAVLGIFTRMDDVSTDMPHLSKQDHVRALAKTTLELQRVPTMGHKAAEIYTNSLLSSFATPMVNVTSIVRVFSDMLNEWYSAGVASTAKTLGGKAGKAWADQHNAPTFREAYAFSKGLISSFGAYADFVNFAKHGWERGRPIDAALDMQGRALGGGRLNSKGEYVESGSFEKKAGAIVQAPTKFGVAIDEYMKAYYRRAKLYQMIEKVQNRYSDAKLADMNTTREELLGKLRGLLDNPDTKEKAARWHTQLHDLDPDIYREVIDYAKRATFQEGPPEMITNFMHFKNKHPMWAFIAPFIRTPWNIGKQGIELIPGVAPLLGLRKKAADGSVSYSWKNVSPQDIAKSMFGISTMMILADQVDRGNLRLGYSKDAAKREGEQASEIPEFGWKIGGVWVDWGRVEPMASFLIAFMGGYKNVKELWEKEGTVESPKAEEYGGAVASAFTEGFVNRQFIYGLSTFMSGITGDEKKALAYMRSVGANILSPPAVSQFARTMDPYMRKVDGIGDAIANRIPFVRESLPVDYNAYGGPRRNPQYGAKSFLPFAGPSYAGEGQTELQKFTSDIGLSISPVGKKLFGVPLTTKQQERVDQLSSQYATEALEKRFRSIRDNPNKNKKEKEFEVTRIIKNARKKAALQASEEFKKENPEFSRERRKYYLQRKGKFPDER